MSMLEQIDSDEFSVMFNPSFIQVIQDHIEYLKRLNTTRTIIFEDGEARRAKHSLVRLFKDSKKKYHVEPGMLQIIAMMNGYRTPTDYDGIKTELLVPDTSAISELISRYSTSHNMM